MAKKKQETVIEAPVTLEEFQAFVGTWKKLKPILDLLAPATSARWDTIYSRKEYNYHWADGYHDIIDGGVYFYYVHDRQYDEGQEAYTSLIPLNAILDPKPVIQAHETEKVNIEKERAADQERWARANYENLKARFEGTNAKDS